MADIELLIKIDEEIMEYVKNNGCLSVVYNDEVTKAIANGTPIPDNATNGEMIMRIANEYYLETSNRGQTIEIEIGGKVTEFDGKWWNAPYQKGGK